MRPARCPAQNTGHGLPIPPHVGRGADPARVVDPRQRRCSGLSLGVGQRGQSHVRLIDQRRPLDRALPWCRRLARDRLDVAALVQQLQSRDVRERIPGVFGIVWTEVERSVTQVHCFSAPSPASRPRKLSRRVGASLFAFIEIRQTFRSAVSPETRATRHHDSSVKGTVTRACACNQCATSVDPMSTACRAWIGTETVSGLSQHALIACLDARRADSCS